MRKNKEQNNLNRIEKKEVVPSLHKNENINKVLEGNSVRASVNAGLYGFAIVMFLIIITKFLSYSSAENSVFRLSINDVLFSFWGFLILSFAKFASYLKK